MLVARSSDARNPLALLGSDSSSAVREEGWLLVQPTCVPAGTLSPCPPLLVSSACREPAAAALRRAPSCRRDRQVPAPAVLQHRAGEGALWLRRRSPKQTAGPGFVFERDKGDINQHSLWQLAACVGGSQDASVTATWSCRGSEQAKPADDAACRSLYHRVLSPARSGPGN